MDVRRGTQGTLLIGGPYAGSRVLCGTLSLKLPVPAPADVPWLCNEMPVLATPAIYWADYERMAVELPYGGRRFFFTVFVFVGGEVTWRRLLHSVLSCPN